MFAGVPGRNITPQIQKKPIATIYCVRGTKKTGGKIKYE
jgi:hypothetical protein